MLMQGVTFVHSQLGCPLKRVSKKEPLSSRSGFVLAHSVFVIYTYYVRVDSYRGPQYCL